MSNIDQWLTEGVLLVTWISNINYWKTGNQQINVDLVNSSIILASRVDFEHFPRKKNKKLARKIREFRMNFVASRGTFPRYARAWRGNFTCGGKSSRVDGTKITQ